jgi:4-hydroxybenzoate polyprenyltransferase
MDAKPTSARAFIRTMRLKHWAKNALIFVPLLTAHEYENAEAIFNAVMAFICFGLCASGGYFINDLWDLEADRNHEIKKNRPLASGALPISAGILGSIALPIAALALSLIFLPGAFIAVLALYFALTMTYSFYLKRVYTADVLTLSVLFMIRVLAGAVAIGVSLSSWLLAFCIFFFISLAYLKRYSELSKVSDMGELVRGRGYYGTDTDTMFALGIANSTASVVVLALFITSPEVDLEYAGESLLWVLCLVMIFWTNRIWTAARRGEVNEDPVEHALHDRASQIAGVICVLVILVARYIPMPF